MIDGVKIKTLKVIPDERGRLMEILRCDDEMFLKFGQVYMTTAYPGVVKGWHYHKKQADNMAVVQGMMKIVLYDDRDGSPTRGEVNEFVAGTHRPTHPYPGLGLPRLQVLSTEEAIVINTPTDVNDYREPDEFRVPPARQRDPLRLGP
jgi:dTDP-4-dehydrorhamnose 3,5-epimerase